MNEIKINELQNELVVLNTMTDNSIYEFLSKSTQSTQSTQNTIQTIKQIKQNMVTTNSEIKQLIIDDDSDSSHFIYNIASDMSKTKSKPKSKTKSNVIKIKNTAVVDNKQPKMIKISKTPETATPTTAQTMKVAKFTPMVINVIIPNVRYYDNTGNDSIVKIKLSKDKYVVVNNDIERNIKIDSKKILFNSVKIKYIDYSAELNSKILLVMTFDGIEKFIVEDNKKLFYEKIKNIIKEKDYFKESEINSDLNEENLDDIIESGDERYNYDQVMFSIIE